MRGRWLRVRKYAGALSIFVMLLAASPAVNAQDVTTARRDLVASSDFRLRVSAALYLGKAHGSGIRADLERALGDAHPAVRSAAAAALTAYGDALAIPAIERRISQEGSTSVKSQLRTSVEALKRGAGVEWPKTRYVVQLGSMKNSSGIRGDEVGQVLRTATKSRAQSVPGAYVLESDDTGVFQQAAARHIPVLALDGSVTRISQGQSNGHVTFNAQVEYTVRRIPEQTLRGTMTGGATSVGSPQSIRNQVVVNELQNQAVDGAVQSALQGADQNFAKAVR
jgi:HEAT repeats